MKLGALVTNNLTCRCVLVPDTKLQKIGGSNRCDVVIQLDDDSTSIVACDADVEEDDWVIAVAGC